MGATIGDVVGVQLKRNGHSNYQIGWAAQIRPWAAIDGAPDPRSVSECVEVSW